MSNDSTKQRRAEVPEQVFEEFLARLSGVDGISPELVNRLKKLILETKNINEKTLKAALLPE